MNFLSLGKLSHPLSPKPTSSSPPSTTRVSGVLCTPARLPSSAAQALETSANPKPLEKMEVVARGEQRKEDIWQSHRKLFAAVRKPVDNRHHRSLTVMIYLWSWNLCRSQLKQSLVMMTRFSFYFLLYSSFLTLTRTQSLYAGIQKGVNTFLSFICSLMDCPKILHLLSVVNTLLSGFNKQSRNETFKIVN